MADEKKEVGTARKIPFEELASRVEKNQGVPKSNFVEAFKGAAREIKDIILNERPEKPGDSLVIKTPIAAIVEKRFGEHVVTDEKGVQWKYGESFGIATTAPREFTNIANTGFEVKRVKIETKK